MWKSFLLQGANYRTEATDGEPSVITATRTEIPSYISNPIRQEGDRIILKGHIEHLLLGTAKFRGVKALVGGCLVCDI